jgi:signal transduction protein with GAF and PtsI domain
VIFNADEVMKNIDFISIKKNDLYFREKNSKLILYDMYKNSNLLTIKKKYFEQTTNKDTSE